MSSPANAVRATFFSSRTKWFWIAVAIALGAWLMVLLLVADEEPGRAPLEPGALREPGTRPRMGENAAPFESIGAKAFKHRHPVRSSRPSATMPFPGNDGVDDRQSK